MRIAMAADHAGYALKERLRAHLAARGHEVLDLGAHDTTPSDYPDYALAAGLAVLDGRAERAILVCGSGVGAATRSWRGIQEALRPAGDVLGRRPRTMLPLERLERAQAARRFGGERVARPAVEARAARARGIRLRAGRPERRARRSAAAAGSAPSPTGAAP